MVWNGVFSACRRALTRKPIDEPECSCRSVNQSCSVALLSAVDIAASCGGSGGPRIVPIPPDTDTHVQSGSLQYAAAHLTLEPRRDRTTLEHRRRAPHL